MDSPAGHSTFFRSSHEWTSNVSCFHPGWLPARPEFLFSRTHEGFSRKTHRGPMNSMPNMGSMPAMPGLGRNHSYFNRYDKIKVEYLLNLVYHTLKSGTHALRNDFKKRQSVSFLKFNGRFPPWFYFQSWEFW